MKRAKLEKQNVWLLTIASLACWVLALVRGVQQEWGDLAFFLAFPVVMWTVILLLSRFFYECPQCHKGRLLEKKASYCDLCGARIREDKKEITES